jgi:hypothetical protein
MCNKAKIIDKAKQTYYPTVVVSSISQQIKKNLLEKSSERKDGGGGTFWSERKVSYDKHCKSKSIIQSKSYDNYLF